MEEYQKEDYRLLLCSDEIEFYNEYTNLLNLGYNPIKPLHLSILLNKDSDNVLLSYELKDNIDLIKLDNFNNEYKITKPGIISIINSIKKNYNNDYQLDEDELAIYNELFDKSYDNVILLILDGLGSNVLAKNVANDSFLVKHKIKDIEAPFPSTTAAALTTIKSGLLPIESGWTGWHNYFKELNRSIILFNGIDYYTKEPTMVTGYDKMPYKMFYEELSVNGYSIEPDFKNSKGNINEVLSISKKYLKHNGKQIQYVYWTNPDGIMHEYGTYSDEAKICLLDINKKLEKYINCLPKNTLLIITADHGHTPVKPIRLYECKGLMNTLERLPQNDARCVSFKIKDGMEDLFNKYFMLFEGIYCKINKEEAYNYLGYKYASRVNERIDDFIGDCLAVTSNDYYFMFKDDDFIMKSHHAGNSIDEMVVPLIVFRS